MKTKKAYFFVLDALLAIFILATGIYIIQSTQLSVPQVSPTIEVGGNVLNLLSTAKVWQFTNPNPISGPFVDVINFNNTILEAIGEQVYLNKNNKAQEIFNKSTISNNIIDRNKFGINASIIKDSSTIINLFTDNNDNNKLKLKSKSVVASRKVIFGYYEDSDLNLTYWGPYTVRLEVWQLK